MQQQCSHDVRFSVVDEIMVDNRMIPILCAGDYEQAKQRLFQYAQSIPVNGAVKQEGMITNGERTNHVVAGREARTAFAGRRGRGDASPFGGDTLDAGDGVVDFGGDGFDGVGVMA
jgi:hypothetical protein